MAAAAMGFRDQARRPLLLVLLVIVPAYLISRSIAITLPTPRQIGLPGGIEIDTTKLVIAGCRAGEVVSARLAVLGTATALVVAVSVLVTAASFTAASWLPFIAGATLVGMIYAAIGALAGAVLDKLAAT